MRSRRIIEVLRVWRRRWQTRQRLKSIALHDSDWLLDDIGWTREDAWREARKPFWCP